MGEEVFSCGAHAVGAVHSYDGTNAGVTWLMPDPTAHPSPAPSATPTYAPTPSPTLTPSEPPTHSPTGTPTSPPCTYSHVANTNIPYVLCNRGNNIHDALRSGCSFTTLNEATIACES